MFPLIFYTAVAVYKTCCLSTFVNTGVAAHRHTAYKPAFINTCPTLITGLPTSLPTVFIAS